MHSESIARCKHHSRRSWYIAAHVWKIYDFKIEVVPLIINMLFFFYLSSSVDINKIPITANMGTTSLTRTFEENSGVHPFMTSILQIPTPPRHGPLALHFRRQYIIRQLITDSCKPMLLSFIFFFL